MSLTPENINFQDSRSENLRHNRFSKNALADKTHPLTTIRKRMSLGVSELVDNLKNAEKNAPVGSHWNTDWAKKVSPEFFQALESWIDLETASQANKVLNSQERPPDLGIFSMQLTDFLNHYYRSSFLERSFESARHDEFHMSFMILADTHEIDFQTGRSLEEKNQLVKLCDQWLLNSNFESHGEFIEAIEQRMTNAHIDEPRMNRKRFYSEPEQVTNLISWGNRSDVPIGSTLYENRRCLLYTSPSPRDKRQSRMPSSA